jgi:hypothetical protein
MLPAVEPAFGGIRLLVVLRRLPRVLPALALVSPRSFGRRQLLARTPGSREASADSRASTKAPTHHRWSVRSIGVSLNRAPDPQHPLDRKGRGAGAPGRRARVSRDTRAPVRLAGPRPLPACSIAARDDARSDAVEDAAQGGGVVVESLASGARECDRGAGGRTCVALLGDQVDVVGFGPIEFLLKDPSVTEVT